MSNNELARTIKCVCRQGSYEDQLEAVEKLLNEHRPEQLPVADFMQGSDVCKHENAVVRDGDKPHSIAWVCASAGKLLAGALATGRKRAGLAWFRVGAACFRLGQ